MRVGYVLAGVALAAALSSGCGGKEEDANGAAGRSQTAATVASEAPPVQKCPTPSQQMRVVLDGHSGAENAGFLIADQRGYFRDAGLKVELLNPAGPEYPLVYVGAGVDDAGIAPQPQIPIGNEFEESVVAIGSVIPKPKATMIWLADSGIDEIGDLKGKAIGYPGLSFQSDFLEEVLEQAGLTTDDVRLVQEGYDLVPALLKGKVDAIFGGSQNIEGATLAARGAEPVFTPLRQLGIPPYEELVVIARPECVAKYPSMYRNFMSAVARGTAAAVKDPQASTRAIEESLGSDPEAGRKVTEAQVAATLPLLSKDGRIDLGQAGDLVAWMREAGMLESEPPVAKLFTNDYLAP